MGVVILVGFILGAILGSFSKAMADRSLAGKTFLGRSECEYCKKTLGVWDLIPIISYISLRGRCRYCHKKLNLEYLISELGLGFVIGFLFYTQVTPTTDLVFKTFFITVLFILTLTDIKDYFIPDKVVIPSIIIAAVFLLGEFLFKIGYLYYRLSQTVIGRYLLPPHSSYFYDHVLITFQPFFGALISALIISGFFTLLIIITRGKGMGGGDVKLGGFIGLGLGFPNGLLAVMLGFLIGAIAAVFLVVFKHKELKQAIPFGPFLVLGSLIALFWGGSIIDWYIKIMS